MSIFGLLMAHHAQAASQFRGPARDGHFPGSDLRKLWPEDGPPLKWSIDGIGEGYGSAVEADGRIFVNGRQGDDANEMVTVLDLKGRILWQLPFGKAWMAGFPGSRSTPTIVDQRAFLCSGSGQVSMMDLKTHELAWSVDVNQVFAGQCGPWGVAESLLVIDDSVIASPCGAKTTLVALNAGTGATQWQSESLKDKAAYVSPVLTEWAGRQVIITVTSRTILGVDGADGRILWTYAYSRMDHMDHPMAYMVNAVMPVVHNGRVYVTSGYDHWGVCLEMQPDGLGVKLLWKDRMLDNHHGGVVLVEGSLYGSNWHSNRKGKWSSIDWATGQVHYEADWHGKGSIISAQGLLYCYEEREGHVALVRPNPAEFEIISEFIIPAGDGPHWAHPSIGQGVLYVRHGNQLHAYDIRAD